jgi:hypothetical protein
MAARRPLFKVFPPWKGEAHGGVRACPSEQGKEQALDCHIIRTEQHTVYLDAVFIKGHLLDSRSRFCDVVGPV